jgi:CspA family cold shock protein
LRVKKAKVVTGMVKWFDPHRKYGFIERSDRKEDVFVHLNDVSDNAWLKDGDKVRFFVVQSPKGPRAIAVEHLEAPREQVQRGSTTPPAPSRTRSRVKRSSFSYTIYPRGYASTRRDPLGALADASNNQSQE